MAYNPFKNWDRPQTVNYNYGAANAIADIFGAIMQRNADRKANNDMIKATELLSNANFDNQQPSNVNTMPLNQTQTANFMPDRPQGVADIKGTADNTRQGLFNNSVLGNMDFGQAKPNTDFNYEPKGLLSGQPLNNFPIGQNQTQQQTDISTPSYTAQTQQTYATAPNKMDITRAKYAFKADRLKMLKDNGITDFKTYMPQIDAMAEEYGNNMYSQQSQAYTDSMLDRFSAMPNMDERKAYMWAIAAKNKGLPVDPEQFAKVFTAKKLQALNLGDRVEMVDDTKPGAYKFGISPTDQANMDLRRELHYSPSGDAQLNASTRMAAASMRGSGGGRGLTTSQQMARDDKLSTAKAIMAAYNPNGKPFVNKDGEDDWKPYSASEQIRFNQAAEYIKAHDPGWDNTPQPQTYNTGGNEEGAAWYDRTWREVKASNPNMSDQDVTDYLTYMINGG